VFQLFHRSGSEAQRLVGRYLDPAHSWSGKEDARLRVLLRDDEVARAFYDRSVAIHRAALGTDTAQPSGFESRRMNQAVVDTAVAPSAQRSTVSVRGWATALATAAIAILVIQPWAPAPVDSIQSRGAAEERLEAGLVGVGVSGVPADGGMEYEVIASKRVTQGDYLRFSYSNERNELEHLFVFGLQERKAPHWYAPMPPFENRSLSISHATGQTLPFEAKVGEDHARGRLRIVSIFSERRLSLDEAMAKLGPGLFTLADAELSDAIHQRLGLSTRAVVQVLETRVEVGKVE
jgi:hypothetical protein